MRAYEFPAKVTPEGTLELPPQLQGQLASHQTARVIVLVSDEITDASENEAWSRLTAAQSLAGYSEADAIYDQP